MAVDWALVLPWVVVITIVVTFVGVTVIVAVEVTPWAVAVMVAVPMATPVTNPPAETVATEVAELDQPTEDPVRFPELLSEYLAVAVSCCVMPVATVAEAGVMKIELIEGLIKKPPHPLQVMQRRRERVVSTVRLWLLNGKNLPADAVRRRILANQRHPVSV